MTVAFDAVGAGVAGGSTWTHTVSGLDRIVLVAAGFATASSYSLKSNTFTATYGGVPMTQVGVVFANNTDNNVVVLFALLNPPTTPNAAVTISSSGTAARAVYGNSVSYTGVAAVNAATPVYGVSASGSITVPSSSQDWALAVFTVNKSAGVGTLSQTPRFNGGDSGTSAQLGVGVADAPGAVSVPFTATFPSSGNWAALGVDLVNASTPIPSSDSAAATDVGVVAANRPEADSTTGTDVAGVAAQAPSTDTGMASESQRIAITSTDTAQAVDSGAVTVPRPSTDSVAGTDTAVVAAKTVATDTSTVTDTGTTAAKTPSVDAATTTDSSVIRAIIKSSDAAVWLEAGALTAATDTDTAHATESGGVVLPGYTPAPKRTWHIPAENRTWQIPRGEHSYKPAPGTAPYTLPFTLTA